MGNKKSKNKKTDRKSNLNQLKIETANELGLDYKDGKFTGKISKEAMERTQKHKQ
ncbi:Small, acid-soluble spore protein, alpha/beta type [Alkalithermobacter thermoalcaliphilus JW-YL-7 = DSM 7308]|uniref:Small acid-soluble spore protein alpha/beta type n=1 Tax=Alkalithermobacter thermoalcaliphilus JW-YL-7 = DSM 7308 TaxID=1121328 RepID=A0A150FQG7_CLOPD|nr:small acid-soluble spore protein alpha/beta type [[Clostridium] paradoxum JW-YL-7 = DSM 7308]SHK80151.1 Small, acid-soluble spore protein, alpha/beta type [[Clostridium] paradoxum JW-YL-7 = DSM 7308]